MKTKFLFTLLISILANLFPNLCDADKKYNEKYYSEINKEKDNPAIRDVKLVPKLEFEIDGDKDWDDNSVLSARMKSKTEKGGSFWETVAFKHQNNELYCGIKNMPYTATITSLSPIEFEIYKIKIDLKLTLDNKLLPSGKYALNSIGVSTGHDASFSDAEDITIKGSEITSGSFEFYPELQESGLFYQIRIEFSDYEYDWIYVEKIEFYTLEEVIEKPDDPGIDPEEKLEFSVNAIGNQWDRNSSYIIPMISNINMGGSFWKAEGFTNNQPIGCQGLCCGIDFKEYTSTITNLQPITSRISRLSMNLSIGNNDEKYLGPLVLRVSDSSDFTESEDLTFVKNTDSQLYNVIIPTPKENMYYQIRVNTKAYKQDWAVVNCIDFYSGGSRNKEEVVLSAPSVREGIATGDGAKKVFSFKSDSGELHILASVFNYDYTFIKDLDFTTSNQAPSNSPMRSIAATDQEGTDWRNKVADKNVEFLIYPEQESKHFTKVRAKSVDGNTQSEELVTWFHNGGITTGILEISDNEKIELWYNLQGERVTNPSNGMFIHVINGKVNKVIIP